MGESVNVKFLVNVTNSGVEMRREMLGEVFTQVIEVQQALTNAAVQQKLVELGWTPPGAYKEEVLRLSDICQRAHDRLLRGDEDAEILAMLEEAWNKPPNTELSRAAKRSRLERIVSRSEPGEMKWST